MLLSETLLTAKFRVPVARPDLVTRRQLVASLDEGLARNMHLTLVSAPAGFGKTTLVAQWVAALSQPVAWVTYDREDDDAYVFLRYVFAALRQGWPDFGARIELEQMQTEPPRALVIALLNELARANLPVVLALDDYHAITQLAVHELVAFMLDNQPLNLHLVIITREDPPLPLARMRARGQINEVRERALRFNHQECVDFFTRTMNLNLAAQSVRALEDRTEGWVTALQLAGVAMCQSNASEAFIASFAGNDRYIVDYVMNEVLAREPESLRQFLCQTSILDRFCAPLCQAVTGREDAQEMLEYIERVNLFLVPLDNRREWYRYHSLFADVQRLSLADEDKSRLHQQAAAWYAANGLMEQCAYHQRISEELRTIDDAPTHMAQSLLEPLSEREVEIMHLIAGGDSNAEIAGKLFITVGTTKRHINNIFGKLGVHSRGKAISRSLDLKLI